MKRFQIFLGLWSLVWVGYTQAQVSPTDASVTSSLISPRTLLKDMTVEPQTAPEGVLGIVTPPETPSEKGMFVEERDIDFNSKDGSLKGRLVLRTKNGMWKMWRFGFEIGGKSANGYTSLFKGGNVSPDARVDIFAIYSLLKKKNAIATEVNSAPFLRGQWLGIRAGYRRGEYRMKTDTTSDETSDIPIPIGFTDKILNGPSVFGHYNVFFRNKFFMRVSVGGAYESNYSKLSQIEVTDTQMKILKDGTSRVEKKNFTAREGTYKDFGLMSGSADILWIPSVPDTSETVDNESSDKKTSKIFALGVFVRYTHRFGELSISPSGEMSILRYSLEPGVGLFLFDSFSKKSESDEMNPLESFLARLEGGIIAQYDVGQNDVKFGLVTSYSF